MTFEVVGGWLLVLGFRSFMTPPSSSCSCCFSMSGSGSCISKAKSRKRGFLITWLFQENV